MSDNPYPHKPGYVRDELHRIIFDRGHSHEDSVFAEALLMLLDQTKTADSEKPAVDAAQG